MKNRKRDTEWFAMLDSDWPAREAAFEGRLMPENWDEAGKQRSTLGEQASQV